MSTIPVDKSKNDNLYLQLYRTIEREIINGNLRPGDQLPSYRWTAHKYGINVATVIRAYNMLEAEGIIEIIQGSGCYVRAVNCRHYFADKVMLENFQKGQVLGPIINFSSGTPYLQTYPVDDFKEILQALLEENLGERFAYRDVQGSYELRETLCEYLAGEGIFTTPDCVQILSGSQQGIVLISQELLNKNSNLLVGNPSYVVAVNSLLGSGAQVYSVPMLEDGPDLLAMEELLSRKKIHFFYEMPNFQSPTNICISEEKKHELIRLAVQYDFLIIEDDCQSEIYFDRPQPRSLKSMDTQGCVIYLKSFSKILMPGLRLACMVLPERLVSRMTSAKFYSDISSPDLLQACLNSFLRQGKMPPHLDRMRAYYFEKYRCMKEAIARSAHLKVKYDACGGLFFWVEIQAEIDSYQFHTHMREQRVLFLPGNIFSQDGTHEKYIRLSYATVTNEEIRIGVKKIDDTLSQWIAEQAGESLTDENS